MVKIMYYELVKVTNGERREFYSRLIGGTPLNFADDELSAITLRDVERTVVQERDELATVEAVKCEDDGTRIEIVYE